MMRALALIFLLAGCVTTGQKVAVEPITLAERFERTVLTADNGSPESEVLRWDQPYLIRVVQTSETPALPDLRPMMDMIHDLSGVKVAPALGEEDMTVQIAFASPEAIRPWADFGATVDGRRAGGYFDCFVIIEGAEPPYRAFIYIRNDLPMEEVRFCLWQEMLQALGPLGDMDDRTDTVFRSTDAAEGAATPTASDLAVLELLYNPAIHNGMPRDEALETVRRLTAG